MKKFVRLALNMVHKGLFDAKRASYDRVVDNFGELDYVTEEIQKTDQEILIRLRLMEDKNFYRLLAGEANNFLLASRVSYYRSIQNQDKNAAWQIIELYYSAYFSVHYLIRCAGWGVTNITRPIMDKIQKSALHHKARTNSTNSISAGLYTYEYTAEDNILLLRKKTNKKGGGSHKEAWAMWANFIESLNSLTEDDIDEYAKESSDLQNHIRFIKISGSRFRPSELRGEINYQFKGNVWEFEKKSSELTIRTYQEKLNDKILIDVHNDNDIEKLVSNSKFIVEFASALFAHGANQNRSGISNKLKNQFQHIF